MSETKSTAVNRLRTLGQHLAASGVRHTNWPAASAEGSPGATPWRQQPKVVGGGGAVAPRPALAVELQHGIPFYKIDDATSLNNSELSKEIYDQFFNGAGCIGLKGCFSQSTMQRYNTWCEGYLSVAKNHGNARHPKQAGKYLINDLLEAMGEQDPDLLMELINNPVYNAVMDTLLGFSTMGAFTTHWIEGKGDRQLSHVDYPIHVGSGKFWEASPERVRQLHTKHQINHMLPFYSVQALMAADAMDVRNGSTEVVPFSQQIEDVDLKILDKSFYDAIEGDFVNVSLDQGDCFMFNRRLVHRGGKNTTPNRRNSAIMQCVWLWGVGQHDLDGEALIAKLQHTASFKAMSPAEQDLFCLRLKKPYPTDTTART